MQLQYKDFRDRPLLFIDLEMSGLDPTRHEIIEVGALLVNGETFKIKKEYEVKVKPEHIETADKKALDINKYQTASWKYAKTLKEVLRELNKLAPGAILVGWNIGVDKMFLELAYIRHKIQPSFDYHTIDVHSLAWAKIFPDKKLKSTKLSAVCKHFGIERKDKHRALSDIKVTYEVFRKLVAPVFKS